MRRIAVLAVLGVVAIATPAAAKGSSPSPKTVCSEARSVYVVGSATGKFGPAETALVQRIAAQLPTIHIKGADTKALALDVTAGQGAVLTELGALSSVVDACVSAHLVSALPTTTTTTQVLPQQASGQSDQVVTVTFPTSKTALLHATYQGSDNFVVKGFDTAGQQGDLFVNTIGNYDGVRLLNATASNTPARLQVNANGPWTITISPLITAPSVATPGHYDGNGDAVVIVNGSPTTAHFHNTGDANFVVNDYTRSQRQLLVNEIGNFDGSEVVPSSTLLFEVQSNGAWSVDLS